MQIKNKAMMVQTTKPAHFSKKKQKSTPKKRAINEEHDMMTQVFFKSSISSTKAFVLTSDWIFASSVTLLGKQSLPPT
jgi:hypothetical protein